MSPPRSSTFVLVKTPLHPLEAALVSVTALHLCFLPWALGTMHLWSQLTSLVLAAVGFGLAVLPRTAVLHDPSASPGPAEWRAGRLWRWPVFWAGLALLGYIALQGFNPAWHFARDAQRWWLEPMANISWLPAGVDVPFALTGPWRSLIVFGSLWLLVCSIRAGFHRRQSYRLLFTLLVTNAVGLALLGSLEELTGAKEIFWSYPPSNGGFCASFIYPNHAGAYLNLMVALAAGLAWRHHLRAHARFERAGPAAGFLVAAVLISLMVIFSCSRMSIGLLLTFIALTGAGLLWRLTRRRGPVSGRPEFWPLILALVLLLGLGGVILGTGKVRVRFLEVLHDPDSAVRGRRLARHAAADMLRDYWLLGWGAGCFRYGFNHYVQAYPEIARTPDGTRAYWEHAHNDLLEFPVEFGALGLLPLTAMLGYGTRQLIRRRFWRNAVALGLVVGCSLGLAHAWVDFVFQCPAVLLTWAVLFMAAGRWVALDPPTGILAAPAPRRGVALPR